MHLSTAQSHKYKKWTFFLHKNAEFISIEKIGLDADFIVGSGNLYQSL